MKILFIVRLQTITVKLRLLRSYFTISKPLKKVEKTIDRTSFLRVHRSYLVHIKYAVRLDKKINTLFLMDDCNSTEILIPVTASGLKILNHVVA
ncbi:LytTR family DNA-binding domain-containing protein [Faecalibacter sp. LW9]|uniref:LytTR family DNA-binding domain-containing protein n=1 Tax=Faecalibacter sp. LW9 TaxID=3103144 RepID=UPI002AFE406D|nr:LytTR family DNA-binding domain-containing protein [Faecalibacter sp. LW9]